MPKIYPHTFIKNRRYRDMDKYGYPILQSATRQNRISKGVRVYLIKDLSQITGFSIHTLKYYLKIGLIKEIGRSPETNFRYFNQKTVHTLKKIRIWRKENKSIREIKNILFKK